MPTQTTEMMLLKCLLMGAEWPCTFFLNRKNPRQAIIVSARQHAGHVARRFLGRKPKDSDFEGFLAKHFTLMPILVAEMEARLAVTS